MRKFIISPRKWLILLAISAGMLQVGCIRKGLILRGDWAIELNRVPHIASRDTEYTTPDEEEDETCEKCGDAHASEGMGPNICQSCRHRHLYGPHGSPKPVLNHSARPTAVRPPHPRFHPLPVQPVLAPSAASSSEENGEDEEDGKMAEEVESPPAAQKVLKPLQQSQQNTQEASATPEVSQPQGKAAPVETPKASAIPVEKPQPPAQPKETSSSASSLEGTLPPKTSNLTKADSEIRFIMIDPQAAEDEQEEVALASDVPMQGVRVQGGTSGVSVKPITSQKTGRKITPPEIVSTKRPLRKESTTRTKNSPISRKSWVFTNNQRVAPRNGQGTSGRITSVVVPQSTAPQTTAPQR